MDTKNSNRINIQEPEQDSSARHRKQSDEMEEMMKGQM
jgi:hypothetical protein